MGSIRMDDVITTDIISFYLYLKTPYLIMPCGYLNIHRIFCRYRIEHLSQFDRHFSPR